MGFQLGGRDEREQSTDRKCPHRLPLTNCAGKYNARTTTCCSESRTFHAASNLRYSSCEARGIGSAALKGYQSFAAFAKMGGIPQR